MKSLLVLRRVCGAFRAVSDHLREEKQNISEPMATTTTPHTNCTRGGSDTPKAGRRASKQPATTRRWRSPRESCGTRQPFCPYAREDLEPAPGRRQHLCAKSISSGMIIIDNFSVQKRTSYPFQFFWYHKTPLKQRFAWLRLYFRYYMFVVICTEYPRAISGAVQGRPRREPCHDTGEMTATKPEQGI